MENSAPRETFLSFFPHASAFSPPSPPPTKKKACSLNTKNKACSGRGLDKNSSSWYLAAAMGFLALEENEEEGWDAMG